MLEKLKTIYKNVNIKRYYVIGISNKNNISEYQLIELSFKNGELNVENRCFSDNLEGVFNAKEHKGYPVILHVEGDNIINKSVENKTGYRKQLIYKASPEDFYFYEYHQGETIFVSVTRKQTIDDLTKQIADLQLYVIHLSFGPFVLASLLPIVKGYTRISSSNYTIHVNETELLSFKNEQADDKSYTINGDTFAPGEMPLLAVFLDYKYPNTAVDFDNSFLNSNKNDYKYKQWFKTAGIFLLGFFMLSLTLSHFLMEHYANALLKQEGLYAESQQTIIKINKLKEEKALKEKILETSGITNKSFITKYIAEIGNTIPEDITLHTIHVIPPLKKIKPSEKIKFNIDVITITGETTNDNTFNDWLKKLKKLPWIKKMDIDDYTQETKRLNVFKIKIKI